MTSALALVGCDSSSDDTLQYASGATAGTGATGGGGNAGTSSSGGLGSTNEGPHALLGSPLVFAPTPESFGLSVVLAAGDPYALGARVRREGEAQFGELLVPAVRAADLAEWTVGGLDAGMRYEYEIVAQVGASTTPLATGSAVTARTQGTAFEFALLSDSHIGAHLEYGNQGDETVLAAVSAEVDAANPDFVVNLGDMLDFHQYGFNVAPPDGSITRLAYLNYRAGLGATAARAAHFPVIGNWEGENGDHTPEQIAYSREQRLLYMPGPEPSTYPQGGSDAEDYYAFTWGDALFVVLNVMTYTPTSHLLSTNPGLPDDWTLGEAQLEWLQATLANATSKWRFLLIHHTVGGAAGTPANSAYGRGGGQAAYVGEQAVVHQLMLDYGVQVFFYGHDHVFAEMVVDDIHYSAVGASGAIWMFGPEETGYSQSWLDSGWTHVAVSPDEVKVSFIALGGTTLYDYTLR